MNPFTITCNQCKSEDVFFLVRGKYLTIFCDHCPMQQKVKLVSNVPEKQLELFEVSQ